jgi:hypothetical protein
MKKYVLHFIALLFIAASFTSCDTAKWPLDEQPSIKIDKRLLGQWRVKNKHEEFTLIKENDYSYTVLYKDWRNGDLQKFGAFLSDVEGAKFLNVHIKDEKAEGYLLVRILDINTTTNIVKACTVTDSLFQVMTEPGDVRRRVTEHVNDPKYYVDTTYFYRIVR